MQTIPHTALFISFALFILFYNTDLTNSYNLHICYLGIKVTVNTNNGITASLVVLCFFSF